LVPFGPVVSEELIKIWKVNGRTTDVKWWQYLTWPFGSGELKRGGGIWQSPRQTQVIEGKPKHDGGKDRQTRVKHNAKLVN
jgi:hypothetical protein